VPIAAPQPIQMEQIPVNGFETNSDPMAATVATSVSPDAQMRIPIPAAIQASSISNPRSLEFRKFRSDNFNRMLLATEFWARGLDAVSTRNKLTNRCMCYREGSRFFGLDMTPVFKSDAGALSYSLGVAAAYSILSAKLWNASKNHPRHAKLLQRLSRSLLISDSSIEITTDVHNFDLKPVQVQKE